MNDTPQPIPNRPTLNPAEVADLLGLHIETVYDAIKRGEIPSTRVGRKILIPTAHVRRILHVE